jgi:SpoVK/Ycf46/Vps4 family AAA+-type ATPase
LKNALKGKKIEKRHFDEAIKKVRPTMTKETLESWQRMMGEFAGYGMEGREGPFA